MAWTTTLLIIAASFLGSFVQSVTGFGYAVLALPLIALVMPFQTASVTVGFLGSAVSWKLAWRLREHIDYRILVVPLVASLLGRVVGVHTLVHVDSRTLVIVLGLLLILLGAWAIFFRQRTVIAANRRNGLVTGFAGGVLGGLCGMPGPPLAIYLSSALPDKHRYAATLQALFAVGSLYNVLLYFYYGSVTTEVVWGATFGLVALVVGAWIGLLVFKRIDREQLNRVIDAFVIVMGLLLLATALRPAR